MEKLNKWSKSYWNQIKRNIGLITIREQNVLKNKSVAVFGVGGLGGPLAEQLVRTGCENLIICDMNKFEKSNLNRQLCTNKDIGEFKIEVIEEFLEAINPNLNLNKYYEINQSNIEEILRNVSVSVLTLDDPVTSILIARECLVKQIPLLESWGIPYLWAWWFTSESIDYETCYDYKTKAMTINEIENSSLIKSNLKNQIFTKLLQFPNIKEIYNREKGIFEAMLSEKLPFISIAPVVRLTASYLAFEVIFSGILNLKKKVLAPRIKGYDYYHMEPLDFLIP